MLGAPPDRGFTPDQWGDPAIATGRLAADFTDVEVDDGSLVWAFRLAGCRAALPDGTSHRCTSTSSVASTVTQQDRLLAAFTDALAPYVGDDGGVRFDAPYAMITASRR